MHAGTGVRVPKRKLFIFAISEFGKHDQHLVGFGLFVRLEQPGSFDAWVRAIVRIRQMARIVGANATTIHDDRIEQSVHRNTGTPLVLGERLGTDFVESGLVF